MTWPSNVIYKLQTYVSVFDAKFQDIIVLGLNNATRYVLLSDWLRALRGAASRREPLWCSADPSCWRSSIACCFTDPVKAAIVDELEIPQLSFTDLEVMVRQEE
jgi:hypothetical protein